MYENHFIWSPLSYLAVIKNFPTSSTNLNQYNSPLTLVMSASLRFDFDGTIHWETSPWSKNFHHTSLKETITQTIRYFLSCSSFVSLNENAPRSCVLLSAYHFISHNIEHAQPCRVPRSAHMTTWLKHTLAGEVVYGIKYSNEMQSRLRITGSIDTIKINLSDESEI